MVNENKRRKPGENVNGNFTIRLNASDFEKIDKLCRITGKSKKEAILYAVNQYIGDYEVNSERRVF